MHELSLDSCMVGQALNFYTESQRLAYERSLLTNDGIYVILILIRVNVRLCVYVHVRFAYVCPPDSFVLFADMT